MKIKKLIDQCKKKGMIWIFEGEDGVQWISDGMGVYPCYDLPRFDEQSICKTYDITEEQKSKIVFRYEMELPKNICFADTDLNEKDCRWGSVLINEGGKDLTPLLTTRGVVFIDTKYIKILDNFTEFFERITTDGKIYIAAKNGLLLSGIIAPEENIITEDFVDRLKALCGRCEKTLNEMKDEQC